MGSPCCTSTWQVSQPLSVKKHQDHASTRKGPPPAADTPGCEAVLPTLTTSTMWAWIRAQVKLAYEFELPSTARAERGGLPLLRSLCKAVGLQIVCRDYSLGDDRPFAPEVHACMHHSGLALLDMPISGAPMLCGVCALQWPASCSDQCRCCAGHQ